jgi:hypothetical protein
VAEERKKEILMFVSGKSSRCEHCGGALRDVRESWDPHDKIFVGEQVCRACGRSWLYSRRAEEEGQMAKKSSKRAKGKKAAPKNEYQNRKAKPRLKKKMPRSQPLPGMEQVRNRNLDRACESIGESRDQMNRIRREEADDLRGALREMHDKNVVVYRHAGVELVRVPGEEKIRVRTTKEAASDITPESETEAEPEKTTDDVAPESPTPAPAGVGEQPF